MYEFDVTYYFAKMYNTIDIDYEYEKEQGLTCTTDKINRIITKIQKCPHLISEIEKTFSCKKGYHLRFYCSISCDKCRMVFDDSIRYSADTTRKKEYTNIMFDTKRGY